MVVSIIKMVGYLLIGVILTFYLVAIRFILLCRVNPLESFKRVSIIVLSILVVSAVVGMLTGADIGIVMIVSVIGYVASLVLVESVKIVVRYCRKENV